MSHNECEFFNLLHDIRNEKWMWNLPEETLDDVSEAFSRLSQAYIDDMYKALKSLIENVSTNVETVKIT